MNSRRRFIRNTAAGTLGSMIASRAFASSGDDQPGKALRSQFLLDRNLLYLNTGSLGPSPLPVILAVESAMRRLEQDPVSENWGPLGQQMEGVRAKVAGFINARPADILLTRNTTEGLSLIAQSLPLQAGDELLTTTLEHGGAEVGLDHLVAARGALLKRVELPMPAASATEVIRSVIAAVTPRTKVILLSHVNTVTGLVMPFQLLSDACRSQGILLIADGAQAVGNIPVDVAQLGVDAYACSGHKWLFGPKETGFLYTRPGFEWQQKPVFISDGYGTYSRASGTRNVAVMIGLGEAIDWHMRIGSEKMNRYSMQLRSVLQDKISGDDRIRILSPGGDLASNILSFSLRDASNNEVFRKLREKNIVVKLLPQHNALRISCNAFHTQEDMERFAAELLRLV